MKLAHQDLTETTQQRVQHAFETGHPLSIRAGGSKDFYGAGNPLERACAGGAMPLDVSQHCGIIEYTPTELVVTARAGTPLRALQEHLAQAGQMLPFEPPHFADGATLGGTIACGFSGPRDPGRARRATSCWARA